MKLQTTLALLTLFGIALPAAPGQTYERLDVSSTGAFGNVGPQQIVISDDGRIAAFSSIASNLVLPDGSSSVDLYVRDRVASTTVRIASNIGKPQSGVTPSLFYLQITGNGRWIAYSAWESFHYATYVYDRQLGTVTQAASTLAEALPAGITPDGRYLAILGRNLLGEAPYDVWRFDTQTGALILASRDLQGGQAGGYLDNTQSISADGSSIVFSSGSSNLVPNDTNGRFDVFVFDASTSMVERVSVDDAGAGGNRESAGASISSDGTRVAFWSAATNFVPPGVLVFSSAYVRDRSAGTTRLVSQTTAGAPLEVSLSPIITADGRKVAFASWESSVIPGDTGAGLDIFVHDIGSGVTSAVTPGAPSIVVEFTLGAIAGGGRWITFTTSSPTMPNSSSAGAGYVADVGPACSVASYCTALPNSTGVAASIGSQGDPSLHSGTFTLTAAHLPPNAIAIFASGTSAIDPGVPFGNGLRCIGGALVRRGVLHASAGIVAALQDFSAPEYAGTQPGQVLHFQCVYRDPSAGGAAFNSTDALSVAFCY